MRAVATRDIPDDIEGYGKVSRFSDLRGSLTEVVRAPVRIIPAASGNSKLLPDIGAALRECGVGDGATLSFHHHLRDGDYVMNLVLAAAAQLGLRDLKIAASSIFPVHAPLVEHMRTGVITGISTAYVAGPVAAAISAGLLQAPAILQTHGGRVRAIESGDLPIDVAFVAAPTADDYGNLDGAHGPSACGPLGYAEVDVRSARRVVAITDNLVPYPACPAQITQDYVDFVVTVAQIGDPSKIASGTTRVTVDPVGLEIARNAAQVIEAAQLLRDGFSFQTGAGGISLAVAQYVRQKMQDQRIQGSFAAGGITGLIVEMLEAGLFRSLFDVQCFDLRAVQSYRDHAAHQAMSASLYANPCNRGAVVNRLDTMILGASEIDLDFNVNVTTRSNGVLMGGSGGHADTAAGAKLALVTTRLQAGPYPKIVDRVTTITTPGSTIDVLVTEAGVAVNPQREDLSSLIAASGVKVMPIARLRELARSTAKADGRDDPSTGARIVAVQQYRDGTVIDVVRQVR